MVIVKTKMKSSYWKPGEHKQSERQREGTQGFASCRTLSPPNAQTPSPATSTAHPLTPTCLTSPVHEVGMNDCHPPHQARVPTYKGFTGPQSVPLSHTPPTPQMPPPSPVPEDCPLRTVLPLAGSSPHLSRRLQIPLRRVRHRTLILAASISAQSAASPPWPRVSSVPLLPQGTSQEAAEMWGSPSRCRHHPSWPSRPKNRKDIKSPGAALKTHAAPRKQRRGRLHVLSTDCVHTVLGTRHSCPVSQSSRACGSRWNAPSLLLPFSQRALSLEGPHSLSKHGGSRVPPSASNPAFPIWPSK